MSDQLPRESPRLDFLISLYGNCVLVRWLRALDRAGDIPGRELEAAFEEIDGVEKVDRQRYSAVLHVAPHVTTVARVAQAVEDIFRHDANLRSTFRFHFPDEVIDVYNVGYTVRL